MIFIIAVYQCEINDIAEESYDYRVRCFETLSKDEVEEFLRNEKVEAYSNEKGEVVRWKYCELLAIEEVKELNQGEEIIGFISNIKLI